MIINGSTKKVAEVLRHRKPDDDKEWQKLRNEFRHGGKPFSRFDQCFPGKTRISAISAATDRVASAKAKPATSHGPRSWIRHARPASSHGDQPFGKDSHTGYQGVGFRTAGTGTWRSSTERVVLRAPSFGEPYRDHSGGLDFKAEGGTMQKSPRIRHRRPHTVMGVSRISRSADRKSRSDPTIEKSEIHRSAMRKLDGQDDEGNPRSDRTMDKSGSHRSAMLELDVQDDDDDDIEDDNEIDDDDQDGIIGEEVAQSDPRASEQLEEQNLLEKGDTESPEAVSSSHRSPAKDRSSPSQRRPWTSQGISYQISSPTMKRTSSSSPGPNQRAPGLPEPSTVFGRTSKASDMPENAGLPPALRHGRSQPARVSSPAMHKRTASVLRYLSGAPGFPLRPRQPLRAASTFSRFLADTLINNDAEVRQDPMYADQDALFGLSETLPQARNPSSRAQFRDRAGAHPGLSLTNPTAPKRLSSDSLRRRTEKMLSDAERQDYKRMSRPETSGGGVFGLTFANPNLSFSLP